MRYQKCFEKAALAGLEDFELYIVRNYRLELAMFHSEITSNSISDITIIAARGIYKGKMGYAFSEKNDSTTFDFLIDQVKENAKIISSHDVPEIFKGSAKYINKKIYNPEIERISIDQKIATILELEAKAKAADARITQDVQCGYEEEIEEITILNSRGLKLTHKGNYLCYYVNVVAQVGEDIKNAFAIFFDNNPTKFNADELVKEAVESSIAKLGAASCPSKKYKAVIKDKVVASLLGAYLSSISAEEVQKQSSLFAGKLNTLVASKKITVLENPLTKNVFFRAFDDEGVATYNKPLIEKGVLKTFLYNLTSAKKDDVTTTANGYKGSATGKITTQFHNIILKSGKKSEEEIIQQIHEGIYISSIAGLHAGLNKQSGNFSLQAEGFMIRNGKIAEPVNLITIAGNLMDLFLSVSDVASQAKTFTSSVTCSSIAIKKLSVSGQ